jgi:hypothetical protein
MQIGYADEIQTPTHWNQNLLQHDRPTNIIITQQYSSATFMTISFP